MSEAKLMTSTEVEDLGLAAEAMREIVDCNGPQPLCDDVDRLCKLVQSGADREQIRALAEEIDMAGLREWAEALRDGANALDNLTMRLNGEEAPEDEREPSKPIPS